MSGRPSRRSEPGRVELEVPAVEEDVVDPLPQVARERLPEDAAIWHVRVSRRQAAELRRVLGTDRRAGKSETPQSDAPPRDARAFRVDAEEPVVVFVEATWPLPFIGQRHERIFEMLRAVEPVAPDPNRVGPATLGEVVWFARKYGIPLRSLRDEERGS